MIVRLKHVKRVRAKGRTYRYHQITGERLSNDREERAARAMEINRTLKGTSRKMVPGSLVDLIAQYTGAPEFRQLSERTRHKYTRYLDLLAEIWGSHPIGSIERKHVLRLRDTYADTPSMASKLVSLLRIVMAFAIERDYRRDNPARDVKSLPHGEGHATWPDEAVDRFLAVAPPMMALALKIALYTGQREGDVLEMSWHDYNGQSIKVVQNKTGAKLSIPVAAKLREALDAQDPVSPIILTTATGRPFGDSNFRGQFGRAMKAAGLSGLTFHGLRYTAAARLAEAGCSLKEIAAITGHRSLAMIAKYTRGADQERLAGAAIVKLENVVRSKNGKPR